MTALPLALAADAQTLAISVNGDPITTYDIDERAKLRAVLKQPAGREAAIEELIGERLRFHEANRFGGDAQGNEMAAGLAHRAQRLGLAPEALLDAVLKAGVSEEHLRGSLRTEAAWNAYVRARNKGLEVSERDMRAELARRRARGSANIDYVLREVVFIVASDAPPARQAARLKEAEAFRSKVSNCLGDLSKANALQDVAVKPVLFRNSSALPQSLRALLDKTPEGHLTPPQRGPAGIEMLALCDRQASKDDSALRADIQSEIIDARLQTGGERLYQGLRATAVIVRR